MKSLTKTEVWKGMLEGCDSLTCSLLLAFVTPHFVVCIAQ